MSRLANREYYKQETVRLYTIERKSMNQISKELKISDSTVKKLLLEEKIPLRHHGVNYYTTKNLFSEINSHESAYWLGMLYADGSIRQDGYGISLDLKESDKEHVEDFSRFCLNGEIKITPHKQIKNGKTFISYACNFSDKEVHANLIKLGCLPCKSLILKCPSKEQVPDEFIYSFFRGYIDGDGHIQWNTENYHYKVAVIGTKDFLEKIAERLNLDSQHYKIFQDHSAVSDRVYKMEISSKYYVYNFLCKIYQNNIPSLKRKFETFLKIKETME